jgi:hypothetical protein|tara:strand:- start:263 stop:976 length:714 start_codon:yes stop_codon:yes gene_type:complete
MALPKIDQPLFEIVIPSTNKKAKFRPFTVKEEKILLIAQESQDQNQILLAVKQIITNCVHGVSVDDLAVFDLEYLILNIRSKSVNNEVSFGFQDLDTEERVDVVIDVADIKVEFDPDHTKKIDLNDQYYLMMKYPTLTQISELSALAEEASETDQMFSTMISCIDTLIDTSSDEVFKLSEFTSEEVTEFVDGFTTQTVEELQRFFTTMPKLRHVVDYKDNTGKDKTFVVEGMDSFFT